MMITIETKLRAGAMSLSLTRFAELFSQLERRLFVAIYVNSESVPDAKRRFIQEHRITARQFNAIRVQLEARIESWRECTLLNLASTDRQIEKTEQAINRGKTPFVTHQKKRRLQILRDRKMRIEAELAARVPSICFGSKRLFQKQFCLEGNGYSSHEAWLADWRAHRASQFYVLGSADESCGNQTCQYHEGVLHLRMPDAMGGGTLQIPARFSYREEALLAVLTPSPQVLTRGPRKGAEVERCSAVSYRFLRRDNGHWYVQAMFETTPAEVVTSRNSGAVGVDLNPWGVAVTRVDRSGNPVESLRLPWQIEGRTDNQIRAAIGDAVKQIVAYALDHRCPISIERLDFTARKAGTSAKLNRMISAFAYAAFAQIIRGRCAREGVELLIVNPAFTSIIGGAKFGGGYGLPIHNAAACAIARRALNFSEKLCVRQSRYAHLLPVRNRKRHVWSDWSKYAKALKTWRTAQRKGRSQTPSKAEVLATSIPVTRLRSDGRISEGGMRKLGCESRGPTVTNAVRVAS